VRSFGKITFGFRTVN